MDAIREQGRPSTAEVRDGAAVLRPPFGSRQRAVCAATAPRPRRRRRFCAYLGPQGYGYEEWRLAGVISVAGIPLEFNLSTIQRSTVRSGYAGRHCWKAGWLGWYSSVSR